MTSALRTKRISLAAFSGLLQVLIFPNAGLTWLSWIALTPLLYALLLRPSVQIISASSPEDAGSLTTLQGFWIAYLSGVVWYAGSCYWVFRVMHLYGGLSVPVAGLMLLLFALYLGLYHGLFGALLVRLSRRETFAGTRTLIFVPFLWVGVELARARITGFPWDLLGTAQVDNIPLGYLATVTGVYGISFVITWVNTIFAAALMLRGGQQRKAALTAVLLAAGLQAATLIRPQPWVTTHIADLIQQNIPLDIQWTAQSFDSTMAKLSDLSRLSSKADDPAPRLIIWPESPAPFYLIDAKFRTWMSTLASDRDAFIIAGSLGARTEAKDRTAPEIFNSAALIAPSGAFLARYDKVHLVPFGEYVPFKSLLFFAKNLTKEVGTFSGGSKRNAFSIQQSGVSGKIGTFICYESVFPEEIREFSANGAQVFVNISNDGWFGSTGAARQHLNMARMRAIENRRWLLRSTNTGITASIDPYGQIIAAAKPDLQTALRAPYAFVSQTTFYTRHGDWFAYACAIISLLAVYVRFSLRAGVIRGN